jgi:hypothetical protein
VAEEVAGRVGKGGRRQSRIYILLLITCGFLAPNGFEKGMS